MKILVTGAAGFIGSTLSLRLLERGDQVVGIDNHNDYYDPVLKEGFFEYPITPREYRGFKFDYIKTQGKIELEGTEMMRRVKQLKPMIRYQRRAVNQLAKALRFEK